MLNDDNKDQENKELKTPNPLSYPADRELKEEEKENPVRSSSSGSSSTSDLKKRLQDLPSPNKTTRLANRAIKISRRLSRKRDHYFYSAANRIDETDEKEEQQLVLAEGSFNESKYSNARIRRRAKIRLETMQAYTVAASPRNDGDNCNLKSDIGNKPMSRTEEQMSSTVETPRSDFQRGFLSSRTPDTHSPRYNQQHFSNGTSKSKRDSPLLQMFSNLSSENSPRNTVYPVSLCNVTPSRFGGYRPKGGVILQNLSSGSEPGSDYENTLDKTDLTSKIDYLGSFSTHGSAINSDNGDYRNVIRPSVSKISLDRLPSPSVKSDDQKSSIISSSRTAPRENYFYRIKNTPRSDYGGIRNTVDHTIDQRTFLSARDNIHNCYKSYLELDPIFGTSVGRNISSDALNEKASVDIRCCGEKDNYDEKSSQNSEKISTPTEAFVETSRSSRSISADQAVFLEDLSCAKGSHQSLETICWESMFKNSSNSLQYQQPFESQLLSAATSKCFLDQNEEEHLRSPISTNRLCENTEELYSSQLKYCTNEEHDVAGKKGDTSSRPSAGSNENSSVKIRSQHFQEEYVDVPILSLTSQEMSSSASPLSKAASEKHLNADDLFEILSKMSVMHTGNTYRVSRSLYSENIGTGNTSKSSLKTYEDREKPVSSRSHNVTLVRSPELQKKIHSGISSCELNKEMFLKTFVTPDSKSLGRKNTLPQSCEESSTPTNFANSTNETAVSLKVEHSEGRREYNDSEVIASNLRYPNEPKSPGYLSLLTKETQMKDNSTALQMKKNNNEVFRSPKLSTNQKDHKKGCDTDSSFTESESVNNYGANSNCYETGDSVSRGADDSDNIATKMKSGNASFPMNYQMHLLDSTYEGQITETFVQKTNNDSLKNQVGDGRFVEKSNRISPPYKSRSSSPDEQPNGNNSTRVSLEKMAADQFRKNIYTEQARTIQSETSTLFTDKFYESPLFSITQSVSTSKLRHPYDSARFRKKSQDRFPFTMSEKASTVSHKFPGECENLDEQSNSLERTYKLDMHPSITRLAGAGFDDTPTEIIDYISYGEERPTRSRMRGFMQRFSARLKKSKKKIDGTDSDTKMANILYENQDYKGDSAVDSCSESSLLKEFKIYRNSSEKLSSSKESPREKRPPFTKNESTTVTPRSVHSCRRHDRDNLWIEENKNLSSGFNQETQIVETPKKIEDKLKRDSYSVFYVKNSQTKPETPTKVFLPEEEPKDDISTEKKNTVKFRNSSSTVIRKAIDDNVPEGSNKKRYFENIRRRRDVEKGCLCLRFYRMIIPVSKHRSRINHSTSSLSIKRKSRLSPRSRKG